MVGAFLCRKLLGALLVGMRSLIGTLQLGMLVSNGPAERLASESWAPRLGLTIALKMSYKNVLRERGVRFTSMRLSFVARLPLGKGAWNYYKYWYPLRYSGVLAVGT